MSEGGLRVGGDRRGGLRALLTKAAAGDALEASYRARMLALVDSEGDCFSRDRFDPGHFTASAFVCSPEGGELLLILHGKLGLWLQPGGHVDPDDEDVFAAARREVAEEVGIRALDWFGAGPEIFDLDIHTIPARPGREPAHEHFDVRVLFRARTRAFEAGSDAKDARWVSLEDIRLGQSDESVMRAVRKLQAKLGA